MKYLWLFIAAIYITSNSVFASAQQTKHIQVQEKLKNLEKTFDVKIGVYAINTNNNQIIAYHADERFPLQSTFKLMGVSALLKQSDSDKKLLQEKIHYTKDDLIFWCPVTGKYVNSGMTLEELSQAAMSYSDNAAINLIMKRLGGSKVITNFARSIENKTFNIKHYEGSLNSNPKNLDDTSTPKDMAISLQKLTLGNILSPIQRANLITWMKNNTTGDERIRAGVPSGWVVADKTGSGDYGIVNDIGIIWSPYCKPVVLTIYTMKNKRNAKSNNDVVASATKIIFDEFAKKYDVITINTKKYYGGYYVV